MTQTELLALEVHISVIELKESVDVACKDVETGGVLVGDNGPGIARVADIRGVTLGLRSELENPVYNRL